MGRTTNGKIDVSVFISTKNEEASIAACLDGLEMFDEVVVVDSHSSDRTTAIAKEYGARVVDFIWNGAYPKKKQWQLENVGSKHDWILLLDADERPSSELIDELSRRDFATTRAGAFDISLDYWFAGRKLRHGHRVRKRALLHRERVTYHEVDDLDLPGLGELEGHYQPTALEGGVAALHGRIEHNDQDPVRTWFDRHNRYSDWEAGIRARPSTRAAIASTRTGQGRVFDWVPGKPAVFFLYSYVARRGFLDGRAGFDYALALALYYWQIGLKRRELQRRSAGATSART